jgi:hypothetical protein
MLESGNGVGEERWVAAALHCKAEGPVQPGQLVGPKTAGLSLPKADPGDALSVLDLVIEWDRIALEVYSLR